MRFPSAHRTIWHVTFGTYGTRLHGSIAPTVDREHNELGEPFLGIIPRYEAADAALLRHPPRQLSSEQRAFIEAQLPLICIRGEWELHAWTAGEDHVHLLCEAHRESEGKTIRTLIKRWLTQALDSRWPRLADHPLGGGRLE
jgi:hypothetical protein